jgi:hypothetical protein
MTSLLVRISVAAVRTWTRVYTSHMPRSVADARRAEIESDLWECQTDDAARPALPLQIFGRLVLGIFDDVRWRVEHMNRDLHVARRTLAFSVVATALLAGVWIVLELTTGTPPQAPAAPEVRWERVQYPPPAPPPPHPCNPPGIGRKPFSPCTPYK